MRVVATLILLTISLWTPGHICAEDVPPTEYEVKAAFIFNFAKFVQWPSNAFADAKASLNIGVLGDNPFGSHLERMVRDKALNNHPVVVKECRTLAEARQCHVLFISSSERPRLQQILDGLANASVLTVGEVDNFIRSGGMIGFFFEGRKVRFDIDNETAKKAGLKIDSKLLGLARKPSA